MCGIAGYAGPRQWNEEQLRALGEHMCGVLAHRGPDDADVWQAPDGGVLLAHRRLSIIDLSELGRNPMPWDNGRLRITYNGEIYNFLELKRDLEQHGYRFRTKTDTEVILAAYDRWGPQCVTRLAGMFAFAIWDEPRRRLFLARDRFGKKPLYYSLRAGGLSFGSELKALAADASFPRAVDAAAVALYLRYGYVPAPYTIYAAARKLPPAHYAIFENGSLSLERFWDPVSVALQPPLKVGPDEADTQLDVLLKDAVRGRLIADVPLGAFLSGGVDSSLIVAMMQELNRERTRTFTIQFENPEYDESDHAAAVAAHLGTEHHQERCGVPEMLEVVDRLPIMFDEPFADSSAIPTYILSRVTRRHVTVALSGDGGDELFLGYPRYHFLVRSAWLLDVPRPIRRALATMAAQAPRRRVQRVADVLRDDDADRYARFITWWGTHDLQALTGLAPEAPAYAEARARLGPMNVAMQAPVLDSVSYLPEDILTKVDRASMAVGLEARCPLLDHRVAEFALRLPLALKINSRHGKLPLRRLLEKRLPLAHFDRGKMGFGVPLADWLRGPLRDRMDAYLSGDSLGQMGLRPEEARRAWTAFLDRRSHRADRVWNLFALAAWQQQWKPESAVEQ